MTESDQLKWGSHLPALLVCVGSTTGPVLELGVGDFSTPVLHALCCAQHRRLVSVESNEEWMQKFRPHMEKLVHEFIYGKYEVIVPKLAEESWAVSFIDNSPGGDRRRDDFATLLPRSQFVVVHDYHGENKEAIAPLLGGNVYSFVYAEYEPPTLIASVHRTIPRAMLT